MTAPDALTVEQYAAAVLEVAAPLEPLQVALGDAAGCRLAEDLASPVALPPSGSALLDGYAVRVADVVGATPAAPRALPVVGEVRADARVLELSVQPGFAVRVAAGAPLPAGTEAVVPLTWTDGGSARVAVLQAPEPGGWCRRPGDDLAAGAPLLAAGTPLGPPQLALLAAAGLTRVLVRPRPRVVVVAAGAGVVELGAPLAAGQVVDAGTPALAAACRDAGAQPYRVGPLPADPRAAQEALEDHLIRADLVLATGHAGPVLDAVLARLGPVRAQRLPVQPGGTFSVGRVGPDGVPWVGLPGLPVAALVAFEVVVRPALRRMLGAVPLHRPGAEVVLTRPLRVAAGLRQLVRCALEAGQGEHAGQWLATPLGGPGTHPLQALAAAGCLVVVPEDATDVPAGTRLPALLLERRQG